jgi:Tfp pilus assembly PilM family ATPase
MITNYLVMEYYGGELKLLEVKKVRKHYEIKKYLKLKIYDEENPKHEIKIRLKEEGIKTDKVVFILKSSLLKNLIKSFPKIPKKELKLVIDREAKKEAKNEKIFYDFIPLEEKKERDITKQEILLSIAPQELIWKAFSFLREIDKSPINITSFYQSFILGRRIVKIEKTDKTFGILNIHEKKSSFLIFKGDSEYILERDIISVSGEEINEDTTETLLMEINRTIQFFKQKNRGYEISSIYITGTIRNIEEVASALNEMLPFSVNPIPANKILELLKIKLEEGESPYSFISDFFTLFGGIFIPETKEKINLLPSYYYEKEAFKTRLLTFFITTALLSGILMLSTFFIEKTKKSIDKELEKQKSALNKIKTRLQKIEDVKQKREKYNEALLLLGNSKASVERIIVFFNFLTLNTPEGIHLKEAIIDKKRTNYEIKISGITDSSAPFMSNELFRLFYDKLTAFPYLSNISFSLHQKDMKEEKIIEKTINTAKNLKDNIIGPDNSEEKKKQILSFEIKMRLKI